MHFEIENIREFLNTQYNYVHDLAPVADGWWSQALTFLSGEEKLVLRINRHPVDFQKDIFASEHFNTEFIPIPAIKSTGNFNTDYFYCISEFMEGQPSHLVLNSEDLTGNEPTATQILQPLLHIHQLSTENLQGWGYTGANGNGIFNSWEDFLLSIHNSKTPVTWQQLAESTWLSRPLFEQLLDKMKQYCPFLPKQKKVLHGDFGYDNLLLKPNNEVAAVIDWAEMMLGDSLYDLIHMCEPWKQNTGLTYLDIWKQLIEEKEGPLPNFTERMQCYNIHYTLFHLHIHTVRNDEEGYREVEQWAIENLC